MGIYNLIHNYDDDLYYYCPVNDCPCHQPDYYDSSRNNNIKFEYNDEHNVYFNYNHHGSSDNNFCGELN